MKLLEEREREQVNQPEHSGRVIESRYSDEKIILHDDLPSGN